MSCSGIGHNNLSLRGALIIPISGGRQEFLPVTVCKLTSSPGQKVGTNVAFGSRLLQPNGRKTSYGVTGDGETKRQGNAGMPRNAGLLLPSPTQSREGGKA